MEGGIMLYEVYLEFLVFLYDHAIAHVTEVQKEKNNISLMRLYLGKILLCVLFSLLYPVII
jgi:hypothetical protein